ncbi:hypothetical protein MTsDn1_00150 [Alteromonas sp. MTD1]|uniref:tyrosine-type recombinase/integrase n=1 Tax=Alteromonas sp. MTD1 TaxID=3057962 RepID=UPI0036F4086F
MTAIKSKLTSEFQNQYKNKAFEESDAYLAIAENLKLQAKDIKNNIDKVLKLTQQFVTSESEHINSQSVSTVIKKLSKDFQLQNFQLMLLHLLLRMIQQSFGIKSVQIDRSYQIKQDAPLLKPDDFLTSRLQSDLYDLLESEAKQLSYLGSPETQPGFLLLWLYLKEGIDSTAALTAILYNPNRVKALSRHWFYQGKERVWLSSTAELLLRAFWRNHAAKPKNCLTEINNTLIAERIIPSSTRVQIGALRAMLRTEYIFKTSASNYAQKKRLMPSTPLSSQTLYRIMTGMCVSHESTAHQITSITQNQRKLWLSSLRSDYTEITEIRHIKDGLTTIQQVEVVKQFSDQIKIQAQQGSAQNYAKVKENLRQWLHKRKNATATPYCWLLLSWLYHLLAHGGMRKKRLRPRTIKKYINSVAAPVLQEFIDCKAGKMDGHTWAEKLNFAAENINSKSRSHILYFADFVVMNDLVPDLCLSDLDISSSRGSVNANILTHQEAECVISVLGKLNSELSELAQLCFCFGFYSGLRRGEIAGLQYADFNLLDDGYINLHVRANKYRELKSPESARNMPLDVLWPEEALVKLKKYIRTSKTKFKKNKSKIFSDETRLNEAFSIATEAMKLITAEPTIRFHHCRHSFANWLYLLLSLPEKRQANFYPFTRHAYFDLANKEKIMKRLALVEYSRKKLWAVSILLGHSSPSVTMASYIHTSEFLHPLKFANHSPSPRLLRKFWGQNISIDDYGRIDNYPPSKAHLLTAFPKSITHKVISEKQQESNITQWLESKLVKKEETSEITLSMIRTCFEMYIQGHSPEEIARRLHISEQQVIRIVDSDPTSSHSPRTKMSNRSHILNLYKNMTAHQHEIVSELTEKYAALGTFDEIDNRVDLQNIAKLEKHLVKAKDFLIRSYDCEAILSLLVFLKLLGFTEEHLRLRWYFPSPSQFDSSSRQQYRADLRFWIQNAVKKLFPELIIEVIVPHNYAQNIRHVPGVRTITSDEGRFLSYKKHGTVSVHLLESSLVADKSESSTPPLSRRSRAYVCFLRLLFTWVTFHHD